jgi:hypothetical protein
MTLYLQQRLLQSEILLTMTLYLQQRLLQSEIFSNNGPISAINVTSKWDVSNSDPLSAIKVTSEWDISHQWPCTCNICYGPHGIRYSSLATPSEIEPFPGSLTTFFVLLSDVFDITNLDNQRRSRFAHVRSAHSPFIFLH